jgi:glycosyltransferase involved in cell wall biosynthesis
LVLSFSNLSLLPLELMACGVPVIANRGPNVEWLLNNEIAYLSEPQPDALASKVVEVMSLPSEEYAGARARALAFAEATDWEREIDRLADIIRRDAARLQPRPKVVSTLGAMPLPKAQRSFRVAAA